jgi:hypothetical protein
MRFSSKWNQFPGSMKLTGWTVASCEANHEPADWELKTGFVLERKTGCSAGCELKVTGVAMASGLLTGAACSSGCGAISGRSA